MIRRIDHIGVLVRSLEETLPLYTDILGLSAEGPVELPEQSVRLAFLQAGDGRIELLEPMTPDCTLGRILAKRGEGLLHVCLEVDDIEATLRRLEAAGVGLVDQHAWESPIGLVAFIHPKAFRGVSIELRQRLGQRAEGEAPGSHRVDSGGPCDPHEAPEIHPL